MINCDWKKKNSITFTWFIICCKKKKKKDSNDKLIGMQGNHVVVQKISQKIVI